MADYIITLTDEQNVALEYDVEQMNAQHAAMAGAGEPVVWTAEQLLVHRVGMQLDSTYRQISPMLTTVESMAVKVPADHHEALLAGTSSKAVRDYVRAKLQRGQEQQASV